MKIFFSPQLNMIDVLTAGALVYFWMSNQGWLFLIAAYVLGEVLSVYGERAYFGTINGKRRTLKKD